jgi:hypothetical protein
MTTKAKVMKYHTYRGIYTAVVREGNKYVSFIIVDSFPLSLKRFDKTTKDGMKELTYMDEMHEYPLVKAVKTMLGIGKFRGINNGARKFLEDILEELNAEVNTIKQEDMVTNG